jgi:hypothetical protein
LYDAALVERIRRGTASESDDRAARYLIDELEKACLRDPGAGRFGTRYDALMQALEEVCKRLNLSWKARHRSLRAWGKAHDISRLTATQQKQVVRAQFESLLDGLDDPSGISLIKSVDPQEGGDQWTVLDGEITELREAFAGADSSTDYGNMARQCREIFVSLADAAYDENRHGPVPSDGGNVKVRLEAVIRAEARGSANEHMRAMAFKSLNLANKLQHDKAVTRAEAANVADVTLVTAQVVRRLVDQGGAVP